MNKITNADIEKALECCVNDIAHCFKCPYNDNAECSSILIRNCFDYINRLKAEIERLQAVADAELDTIHDIGEDYERVLEEEPILIQKVKVEAVKEFYEKFNSLFADFADYDTLHIYEIKDRLDLVKEMTKKE